MINKILKPFDRLAVRYLSDDERISHFSVDDEIGNWIDPSYDAIAWSEFLVYGFPPLLNDTDEDGFEDDLSLAYISFINNAPSRTNAIR